MKSGTTSLIYVSKDSNTGLLMHHRSAISAIHQQIPEKRIGECVLCFREFLIAVPHNQNTVSFGISKQ